MVSKRRGQFCWCCGRRRPNERFSGAGHARHLCKDCQKLGAEELTYRQAVRATVHEWAATEKRTVGDERFGHEQPRMGGWPECQIHR
jgi:hypothetical protein